MKREIFRGISVLVILMSFSFFQRDFMRKMIPDEVNGWKRREVSFYDKRNIFDYIDGAGELYISYNFRLLMSARYEKIGAPAIIVDLFDMGSSEDAFGVFTFERGEESAGIGQNSYYRGGLLTFWKSQFFVSIYAEEENEETKNAIFQIAREIENSIKEEGKLPGLINLINDFVDKDSVKFFHDQNILNSHYFLSYENILNLGKDTNAVAGKSGKGEFVLIVSYPNEIKAKSAYRKFLSSFMPGSTKGFEKMENGKWSGIGIHKEILILVFDSQSEEECKEKIEKIKEKIEKEKGNE
jgi:hypothetical protein